MAFLAHELQAAFCYDASISSIIIGGTNMTPKPNRIRVNPYVGSVDEVCAMDKDRSSICLAVVETIGKYHRHRQMDSCIIKTLF